MTAQKHRSKTQKAKYSLQNAHPDSRKASAANRTIAREKRLVRNKQERNKHQKQPIIMLFSFFQDAVNSLGASVLNEAQIKSIVESWAHRNQDRLDVFESERKSKQHSHKTTKQELLESAQEGDINSLKNGLSTHFINTAIPDLECAENVQRLKLWDGKYNSLSIIKKTVFKSTDILV